MTVGPISFCLSVSRFVIFCLGVLSTCEFPSLCSLSLWLVCSSCRWRLLLVVFWWVSLSFSCLLSIFPQALIGKVFWILLQPFYLCLCWWWIFSHVHGWRRDQVFVCACVNFFSFLFQFFLFLFFVLLNFCCSVRLVAGNVKVHACVLWKWITCQ